MKKYADAGSQAVKDNSNARVKLDFNDIKSVTGGNSHCRHQWEIISSFGEMPVRFRCSFCGAEITGK